MISHKLGQISKGYFDLSVHLFFKYSCARSPWASNPGTKCIW